MPDTRRNPRFALASSFDARPWSGVSLFERGEGDPVVMPTFTISQGVYLDAVHFLNGYGSEVAFDDELAAFDVSIVLTDDDRIRVINNNVALKATLAASADNAWWGLPVEGFEIENGGGVLTGSSEWRRGLVWNGHDTTPPRLSFIIEGEPVVARCPPETGFLQSIITGLRERGEVGGPDDTTATPLTALDNGENDALDQGYRWFITDDGHVGWCGTAAGAIDGITWLDLSFMRRLGFTGLEDIRTDAVGGIGAGFVNGALYYQIADNPCPGSIVPTRPLSRQNAIQEEQSSTLRLTDGSYSSSWIGSYLGYEIEFVLDGPDGSVDLHRHFLDMRSKYLHAGEPCSLYQSWGDPRRSIHPSNVDIEQTAYDLSYTSEKFGYRGRILCRLHPSSSEARIDWESQIRNRSRITLRLTVREVGV